MPITSRHNAFLQDIRRAAVSGRTTANGLVVAEGPHLLEEALRSTWSIEHIAATPAAQLKFADLLARVPCQVVEVSDRAFAGTAGTENSQGVIGLLRPPDWHWVDLLAKTALVLVLDGIQDPGNAGTLVRSAEAFGASGIVFTPGTVHVSNPKFLRASAGSIFRLAYLEGFSAAELLRTAAESQLSLYVLDPRARTPLKGVDFTRSCALVIGSEGQGVSKELAEAGERIYIPVAHVESLNAAVAGSIALFEASRGRSIQ